MSWFDVFWVSVLLAGGTVELVALKRPAPGDTLSEHMWKWLRVADPRPTLPFIVLRALTAAVMVWLAGHFAMGWWTP